MTPSDYAEHTSEIPDAMNLVSPVRLARDYQYPTHKRRDEMCRSFVAKPTKPPSSSLLLPDDHVPVFLSSPSHPSNHPSNQLLSYRHHTSFEHLATQEGFNIDVALLTPSEETMVIHLLPFIFKVCLLMVLIIDSTSIYPLFPCCSRRPRSQFFGKSCLLTPLVRNFVC